MGMNNSEKSLDQVSKKLIAYLRTALNNDNVRYDVPLTPILGGYETSIFHFKLKGVRSELARPLVLRLFQESRNPEQVTGESAVQNALAAQGYPVVSVSFTSTDKEHLGGAFLIMDFLPGETMLAAADEDMPLMLGKAHAALHDIDPTPLIEGARALGFEEQSYRLGGRLGRLFAKCRLFPWLEESVQWLIENRPPEPESLAICHGDFHPQNILVKDGEVTGVLDWAGFVIADAVMDVAFTMVILSIAAKHLTPTHDWDEVMSKYLDAYRSERPLDSEYLDYYRTLRCVAALVEGAEGQEVWTSPPLLNGLIKHVREIAGVRVAVPSL
jgi:aminoglycoside phosphotransferase (APT) family kinase protein